MNAEERKQAIDITFSDFSNHPILLAHQRFTILTCNLERCGLATSFPILNAPSEATAKTGIDNASLVIILFLDYVYQTYPGNLLL